MADDNINSNESVNWVSGDGIDLTFTETEGEYTEVEVAATGGGSGHTIAEAGVAVTARGTLNFGAGFDITDDAVSDETEVAIDLNEVTAFTDHLNDAAGAHAASAISVDSTNIGTGVGTDAQTVLEELDDFVEALNVIVTAIQTTNVLVGTGNATFTSEIPVGTTPGGELGGTWGSPTVDATHSGSSHAGVVSTHEAAADPHTGYLKEADAATTTEIADIADTEAAGTSDTYARGDHVHSGSAYRATADIVHSITFTKTGNLSTGTGATRWYNDTGGNITLQSARGSVGTAPASQSILVDINNNGTSVWASTQANRITIAAAGNTDEGGAFDDATIADGEYITVDIDQVGSGTVGADLTVTIWWTAA